tara:strand:+ start:580 stop:837 length:258 start_codon:yes stop_codon:yes gene_type:complete
MQAVNYYIIVEKIKTEPKKVGGLILTEKTDADNRYVKANIISVGSLVKGLKEKDVIHYDRHAGHGITLEDKLYKVIQVSDVVLVE